MHHCLSNKLIQSLKTRESFTPEEYGHNLHTCDQRFSLAKYGTN